MTNTNWKLYLASLALALIGGSLIRAAGATGLESVLGVVALMLSGNLAGKCGKLGKSDPEC
jgi:hypothetical protein